MIWEEEEEATILVITPLVVDYVSKQSTTAPLVVHAPTPFLYESDKRVPWAYEACVEGAGEENEVLGITRSGRCYVAPEDPTRRKEAEVPTKKRGY